MMKKTTTELNERKRQVDNKLTVQELYMLLDPPVEQLLQTDCVFKMKGDIAIEGEDHVGLLFSNVFILAQSEKNGEKLNVEQTFPIKKCTVTSIADSPYLGLHNAIQIDCLPTTEKLLFCSTQKPNWLESLFSCSKKSKTSTIN